MDEALLHSAGQTRRSEPDYEKHCSPSGCAALHWAIMTAAASMKQRKGGYYLAEKNMRGAIVATRLQKYERYFCFNFTLRSCVVYNSFCIIYAAAWKLSISSLA